MKLIIQIPAYNEADILPTTIQSLPNELPGIDQIEILVIDDGSDDGTAEIAKSLGVQHVLQLQKHTGLAAAFIRGLETALQNGADVIVNTDADNQYYAEDIIILIEPILSGQADLVVGDRGVGDLKDFSASKRILQRFGSWVMAKASGVKTPDATSGFRAISREAALRTLVQSEYSYTLETLIQAGARQISVAYIPIRTNPQTRPSRLMKSIPQYIAHSGTTIIRAYTMYSPLKIFSMIAILLILGGVMLGARYMYFYLIGRGAGHVQSVIFGAVLMIVGFQVLLIGLLADLVGFNRQILEEVLYRIRRIELSENSDFSTETNQQNDNTIL